MVALSVGVIRFPGSNCDEDMFRALSEVEGISPSYIWHEEKIPKDRFQAIIIPGGFSFGDYLRTGAIAKMSPAVRSLPECLEAGVFVLGICNGFQILVDAQLLPGALIANKDCHFVSKVSEIKVDQAAFPWLTESDSKRILRLPVAHGFGNFQPMAEQRSKGESSDFSVCVRYQHNFNGSHESIAGITKKVGRATVTGMMPHPERASFSTLRLTDGRLLWQNLKRNLK